MNKRQRKKRDKRWKRGCFRRQEVTYHPVPPPIDKIWYVQAIYKDE